MLKRAAKHAAKEHGHRDSATNPLSSPVPPQVENSDLQEAREREAEAKARSDQVDAEFRTHVYNFNTVLGALLGLPSQKDETDDE